MSEHKNVMLILIELTGKWQMAFAHSVDSFNTVIIMSNDSDIVEILIVMCGYEHCRANTMTFTGSCQYCSIPLSTHAMWM